MNLSAAGFTPGEAEKLRRTISAWKSRGKDSIPRYRHRFIEGEGIRVFGRPGPGDAVGIWGADNGTMQHHDDQLG